MFVALYEMTAKPGCEDGFERAWALVTDAIYRVRGSLGSRLHKTEKPGVYIAYAQWPSREVYEDESGKDNLTGIEKDAFDQMKRSASQIRTLHLMEVSDDRLKTSRLF
jgi:heme-degrading monooxygenase HmoA